VGKTLRGHGPLVCSRGRHGRGDRRRPGPPPAGRAGPLGRQALQRESRPGRPPRLPRRLTGTTEYWATRSIRVPACGSPARVVDHGVIDGGGGGEDISRIRASPSASRGLGPTRSTLSAFAMPSRPESPCPSPRSAPPAARRSEGPSPRGSRSCRAPARLEMVAPSQALRCDEPVGRSSHPTRQEVVREPSSRERGPRG
jgi:hypothetical protein